MFVGDHVVACISFPHSGGPSRPKDHIRAGRVLGYLLFCRDSFKVYLFQPTNQKAVQKIENFVYLWSR